MDLFKRAASAAVALVALCSIAFGAGTIPLSGTQQFDTLGRPLAGGLLYTFVSGTTTPQTAYQDQGLTIPFSNPMTLDASGRVPFFYLADGNIKIRLSDSTGVTQVAADGLLVIGPSSGGGGGGGVDATTVLATGDTKSRYGTGVLSGFVRMNGRTLGSATSGATERANSDAQALFEYLWTTDANLTVSTGRGASANADWLANKTITLPDMRGRIMAGMDDMGASAASRLTTSYFGASAIVLGASGGLESMTLDATMIPSHLHGIGSIVAASESTHTHGPGTLGADAETANHQHFVPPLTVTGQTNVAITGATTVASNVTYAALSGGGSLTDFQTAHHTHTISGATGAGAAHTHTMSGSTGAIGGGLPHRTVQPTMVMTFYIKL